VIDCAQVWLRSWYEELTSEKHELSMPTRPQPRARLCIEILESRRLLSQSPILTYSGSTAPTVPSAGIVSSFTPSSTSTTSLGIVSSQPSGQESTASVDGFGTNDAGTSKVLGLSASSTQPANTLADTGSDQGDFSGSTGSAGSTTSGLSEGSVLSQQSGFGGNTDQGSWQNTTASSGQGASAASFYQGGEPRRVIFLHPINSTQQDGNTGSGTTPPSSVVPSDTTNNTNEQGGVPASNGPVDQAPTVTLTITVVVTTTTQDDTGTNSQANVQTDEPSVPVAKTPLASTKQADTVAAASDSAIVTTVRAAAVAPSAVITQTGPDHGNLVAPSPPASERRMADSMSSPIALGAVNGRPEAPGRPPDAESTPPANERTVTGALPGSVADSGATSESSAELATAPLPLPQGAGLLDGQMPPGLAALERAIRALTGEDLSGRTDASFLLRCVVFSSWMFGAVLAWAVARRKSAPPEIALTDACRLGDGLPLEEDQS
jgi:hypothetical protein